MKVDILAIGAHPDDVELGCGGSIAKMTAEGKIVAIIDLTRGELGTRGTDITRAAEAAEAMKILGVSERENLEMEDGFIENSKANQLKLVKAIRKYKPTIVLANALKDRHPDHAKAAKLVSDACFLSGLPKVITEDEGKQQEAWRPSQIFHYIQWEEMKPDFVVDISGFIDKKVASCMAYKTQFYDPESKEPKTPIATKNFIDSVTYRARNLGRLTKLDHAEGFLAERLLSVENFDKFILK